MCLPANCLKKKNQGIKTSKRFNTGDSCWVVKLSVCLRALFSLTLPVDQRCFSHGVRKKRADLWNRSWKSCFEAQSELLHRCHVACAFLLLTSIKKNKKIGKEVVSVELSWCQALSGHHAVTKSDSPQVKLHHRWFSALWAQPTIKSLFFLFCLSKLFCCCWVWCVETLPALSVIPEAKMTVHWLTFHLSITPSSS